MNKTMLSILRVLEDCPKELLGSREIARKLRDYGVELTERTVRYHMRILDERGYTRCVGKRGRSITSTGSEELCNAQVTSRLGFVISKIETLSYQVDFNPDTQKGDVILNFTFFPESRLAEAVGIMRPVFESRYCVSDRVVVLRAGESLGNIRVPTGMVGFGTVCSITVNGILLKAGIPVTSVYGGTVEIADEQPRRFTAIISYAGTSMDPLEMFIKSRMTRISNAVRFGSGVILGSFREIPSQALGKAREMDARMKRAGIGGIHALGNPNRELLEVPVGADRVGMLVVGGLNPIAALEEEGIPTISAAMSMLYSYPDMVRFESLV